MASTDIKVYRGDDVTFVVTITDSAGDAVDITDGTLWFTVKKNKSDTDTDASIQKEVTSHTTPGSGITAITLSDSDTDLDAGQYFYDIQFVNSTGDVTTYGVGNFIILQDVTNSTS